MRFSVFALAALTTAAPASAYTIYNPLAAGCHERITTDALRAIRLVAPTAAPLAVTDDERALIADLQFVPDDDMRDLGGSTLLIAVRDNDLKGRGSGELDQLAQVHGNPDGQREHCLRDPAAIEPSGSTEALAECRTFIREQLAIALDGLDASGAVDPNKRTNLRVYLELRGGSDVSLPTFYVGLGRAIHTVEDSFTHSYRTADSEKVTVILNWLGLVDGTLEESVGGPPHAADLDRCDDPSDLHKRRRELATNAVSDVMRLMLDPTMTRDQKLTAVEASLDRSMGFKSGCTIENGWCNAPEAALPVTAGCGCNTSPPGGSSAGLMLGMMLLGVVVMRKRPSALLALLLVTAPFVASAQTRTPTVTTVKPAKPHTDDEGDPLTPGERAAIPAPPTVPVAEAASHDPDDRNYSLALNIAGSFDQPAAAISLGFRGRLSKHWMLGIDGEWNPWIAVNTSGPRGGVINLYATAMFRLPLAYEVFNLRGTAQLGGSYLLTDLYGAPSGSIGIFAAAYPLGLEWKVSRLFYLIINPVGIAVPVPQLSGVPLAYVQYRGSIGIELDL